MERQKAISFEAFFNRELSSQLDEETRCLSGGFDKHPNYTLLRAQGTLVLSQLFNELRDPERGFWWRAQMIDDIASDTGQSIQFAEDEAGRLESVAETIITWGHEQGYMIND